MPFHADRTACAGSGNPSQGTRFRPVDIKAALEHIGLLLRRHADRGLDLPAHVVLLGGTAMAAHGLRPLSHDVDIYANGLDKALVKDLSQELRAVHGPDFGIDVADERSVWTGLPSGSIEDSPGFTVIQTGRHGVPVMALRIEDLYLVKSASIRDKDARDAVLLAPLVDAAVLTRRREAVDSRSILSDEYAIRFAPGRQSARYGHRGYGRRRGYGPLRSDD